MATKRHHERESRRFQRGFQILTNRIPDVALIESPRISGVCWMQSKDLTNRKIGIYESGLSNLDSNVKFITNKINENTNVIVVCQTIGKDAAISLLKTYFKPEEYSNKFVVNDEWVQTCVAGAKLIDLSPYLVHITPVNSSSSIATTTTTSATTTDPIPANNATTSSGSKRIRPDTPKLDDQSKYFCVNSGTVIAPPPVYNEQLLGQLELCKNAPNNTPFQKRNYDIVINLVKGKGKDIRSLGEFQEVYRKSEKSTITMKVREFFESGVISKAELVRTNPEDLAVIELKSVWGIGEKTAKDLVRVKKVATIEELRCCVAKGLAAKEPAFLSHSQLIGLNRHEEISQKIPRDEVEQILEVVKIAAHKLEPNCEVVAGGSYRRGELICGDVDIIIGPAHGKSYIGIGPQLIDELTKSNFITDQLTRFGSKQFKFDSKKKRDDSEDSEGASTGTDEEERQSRYSFMGVCKLPNGIDMVHRRIDIKTYPRQMFPYAILAFTGSAHFNRSMRFYSRKAKNMQLSDQGLWNLKKDDNGDSKVKVSPFHPKDTRTKGSPIVCQTEEEIFKAVGLPYKSPNERSGLAVASDGIYVAVDPNDIADDSDDEGEMYFV